MKPSHFTTPRTMDDGVWMPGGAPIQRPHHQGLGFWDFVLLGCSGGIIAIAVWIFCWLVGGEV
jgi:hypothetical protein